MRKPWMRELKNFRFTRCGCMLQETKRKHDEANRRDFMQRHKQAYEEWKNARDASCAGCTDG